jgi:hypothetical protein
MFGAAGTRREQGCVSRVSIFSHVPASFGSEQLVSAMRTLIILLKY